MLWRVGFKPRLGKLREVFIEAGEGRERLVAETWARGKEGTVVGPIEPFVVADEGVLAESKPVVVVTAPSAVRPLK